VSPEKFRPAIKTAEVFLPMGKHDI